MYNRNGRIFIEVSPEDAKLIRSGLDKLCDLEAVQPRKARTYREGTALEYLLTQLAEKPEPVAMAIWCVDDVLGRAKELNKRVSCKQAIVILNQIDDGQDCELGINWTTIDCALEEMK